MMFKAALELPLQDEEESHAYVSGSPNRHHKFDAASGLCVFCLGTKTKCGGKACPGLLNPSIIIDVGP